ncbi:MAG: glycoside hydrolase N-terminal domain-containing protein, partial [Phycisphaerae bacterium]
MCTRKTLAAVMLAALLGGAETLPAQRKASEPKDAKMSPAAKVSPMSLEARRTVVAARGMSSLSPADRWEDALISGNGKMGVLVFGRPLRERVIFNHERFNLPQWRTPPQPPDIAHVMPEVKRLLLAGKYAEGLSLSFAAARKAGHPGLRWTDSYHPGCAMDIVLPDGGEVGQYVRAVDFTTGEATVRWRDGRGDWLRRTFVSRADNVIVQCLTAPSGGKLNCTISLDEKLEKLPRDVSFTRRVTPGLLLLRGRYSPQVSDGGFEVVMRVVVRGGRATARDDRLVVADAREVLLLTRLAWYRNLSDAEKKPVSRDLAALGDDYATLLRRHAEIHGRVFGRVTLDLGGGEDRMLSAEELRAAATADRTYRAYLEKMFDMGRYVFLSSCGDWPPRLTGVWNGSWAPPWRGDFTTDANVNLAVASGNIG